MRAFDFLHPRKGFRTLACACLLGICCFSLIAHAGEIHKAASKGDVARMVALLKDHPELVNSKDSLGNTPLHLTAEHNQPEAMALLLANGAEVDALNGYGEAPLNLAMRSYGHTETLRLLIRYGANLNRIDKYDTMPLAYAMQRARSTAEWDTVRMFLLNGANPDTYTDKLHHTVLFSAIYAGKPEIVELMLKCGANPNARSLDSYYNSGGDTPLLAAQRALKEAEIQHRPGFQKIVDLLTQYGAL